MQMKQFQKVQTKGRILIGNDEDMENAEVCRKDISFNGVYPCKLTGQYVFLDLEEVTGDCETFLFMDDIEDIMFFLNDEVG